jgi:PAS domain S-box-containing protein
MKLQESDLDKYFNIFEFLFDALPYVFWKGKDGRYRGANQNEADNFGFSSPADFIGKTIFEILEDQASAQAIEDADQKVMRENRVVTLEEKIITPSGEKYYLSQKSPIHDENGEVIGLFGFSMDITEQKKQEQAIKEAEQLQLQKNALQEVALQEKEKLIALAHSVAHDISSPLSALSMMMYACDELPERKRTIIKRAVESILDIANNLLSTYRNDPDQPSSGIEERQPVLVSDLISQLLSEKKAQYANHSVQFETVIANDAQFAFIQMQASQFRRSLSNLINNAVDALNNKEGGVVTIKLSAEAESVVIAIHDNGKGMPDSMIQKMLQRKSFTEGKQNGHGLGLRQVWNTLDFNQGTMAVDSMPGKGTTIQLIFPRIDAAIWVAQEIPLTSNSIIAILDDDDSIHGAWDTRFAPYVKRHPKLAVHHFKQGRETLDFFNTLNEKDKERVVFLSDYELLRQVKTGLEIIKESGIKNATLVTSYYANPEIRNQTIDLKVKILPKQMASIVPIAEGARQASLKPALHQRLIQFVKQFWCN